MKKIKYKIIKRCFSLVEVMAVIVIIGLIAGLAVPAIIGKLDDSKIGAAETQLKLLQSCLKSYYMDNDKYPEKLEDLINNPDGSKKWKGPYLEDGALPKDPWDNDYVYVIPGENGKDYNLMSYGRDKAAGGEGNDADISCWQTSE